MRNADLLGLLLLLALPVTAAEAGEKNGTTVLLEGGNIRVEARCIAGRLQERYLAKNGEQWFGVATAEPGGSVGPVSLLYEPGSPAVGQVRSLSVVDEKLLEEFDVGRHRVQRTVTILEGGPWIRVATQLVPKGPIDLYSFRDQLRFSYSPDWSYSSSIGGFVYDGYYKAPLVLVQSGRKAFGIVPDLTTLHRDQLRRCNHAIGLNVPSGPILSAGFTPAQCLYHSVYGSDSKQRWKGVRSRGKRLLSVGFGRFQTRRGLS